MKTLIICNEKGECVLTLTDVNDKYNCSITDVAEYQIAIGKDLETNKIELEQVKKANEELNGDIKEELQKLKSSNIEIIDYINIITSEK